VTNDRRIENLSAPLDGATTAKVDIDAGTGNLTLDQLPAGEHLLASGTLEYFERQGAPIVAVHTEHGQATLRLRGQGGGLPWFRLPWVACSGATEWRIHFNPLIPSDMTVHTGGGNVKLNLAGMAITRLLADTGGGNLELVLPDHAANLSVLARTGAGNVTIEIGSDLIGNNTLQATSGAGNVVVRVPRGLPAKVHASSGLGKVTVDPRFSKIDRGTYQSPDYDGAVDRIKITAHSGAGNVSVGAQR